MEIWKTVKVDNNILNDYECSNKGRIRNIKSKYIMKPQKNQSGYQLIHLNRKTYLVHKIIAETFIPNIKNCKTINHKNNKRDDNSINNLEWTTHIEQEKHKRNNNIVFHKPKKICQLDSTDNKLLNTFNGYNEIATFLGKNYQQVKNNIRQCFTGKRKTAYGYLWKIDQINKLEGEEWKNITELNRDYSVSNYGRMKQSKNGFILTQKPHHNGYQSFKYNKTGKSYYVHRFVAQYFIDENIKGKVINHKDFNKSNNNVNNLEIITHSQNTLHSIKNRHNIKKVVHYDNEGNIITIYDDCAKACKALNVCHTSIYKCCQLERNHCGKNKLKFKYLSENDDLINKKVCTKDTKRTIKKNWKRNGEAKQVILYKNNEQIKIYPSIVSIHKELGYAKSTILSHCNGTIKYSSLDTTFRFAHNVQKYLVKDISNIYELAINETSKFQLHNLLLWFPSDLYKKQVMLNYPIEKLVPKKVLAKNKDIEAILKYLHIKKKTHNKNFIILCYKYIYNKYVNIKY